MKRTSAAILLTLALCAAAGAQSLSSKPKPPRARKAAAVRAEKSAGAVDEVEQLFDRFFLAAGGMAVFTVKTRIMRGNVEMSDTGATAGFESYEKLPRKSLIVVNAPGGQFIQASDGGKKWIKSPWAGVTAAPSAGGDDFLNRLNKSGSFKWRSLFSSVRVKGRESVEGRPATVVAATPLGSEPRLMYFDVESGLLVRLEFGRKAGGRETELKALHIDSFATVDGIKVPAVFRHVYDKFTMTFRVYEVKHDVVINDALFADPNAR